MQYIAARSLDGNYDTLNTSKQNLQQTHH